MKLLRNLSISALVVAGALGTSVLALNAGGLTLYPFRQVVLLVLGIMPLISYRIFWMRQSLPRFFVSLGYVWVVWGGFSVFWAPSVATAITDVLAVAFGFGVGIALLALGATKESAMPWLRRGWVTAFLVTGGVAVWEITTGNHLPSAFVENMPDYALRTLAISTFGNPNNYGAFLALALPLLLLSYDSATRPFWRALYGLMIPLLFVAVFLSASRSALLGVLLQMLLYVFVFGTMRRIVWAVIGAVGILVGAAYAGMSLEEFRLLAKLQGAFSDSALESGSLSIRLSLTLNGLWMIATSYGLGVGAGGYEQAVQDPQVPFGTGGLINPHNFWIEIASEYGLVVIGLFVILMARFMVIALRAYRKRLDPWAQTLLLMGLGYLLATVANSTYVSQPANWMAIATLMCGATYLKKKDDASGNAPPA